MNESDSTKLALGALLLLGFAFLVLGFFTVVILIRRFIIIPKVRSEFLALHRRRVARARQALAEETANEDAAPAPGVLAQAHSFSGWLTFGEDGTITIAGQTFRPGDTFAVTARDANNIPHVKIAGNGQELLITSHGLNYRAKFAGGVWDVQLIERDQP
jgi:hypothetical protein